VWNSRHVRYAMMPPPEVVGFLLKLGQQKCRKLGVECVVVGSDRGKQTGRCVMTSGRAEVDLTAHMSRLRGIAEQYVEVTQKYEGMESRLNSIEDLLRQVSVYSSDWTGRRAAPVLDLTRLYRRSWPTPPHRLTAPLRRVPIPL
jgi:hypothetical protein